METAGGPSSYLTLEEDTAVIDRFGCLVGEVRRVLVLDTGAFDGIIVQTSAGRRFVDAPEVRRISAHTVTLGIAVADVLHPAGVTERVYGVLAARHDRTQATEADRDAAIERLKRAYVDDSLTTEELEKRVVIAHSAVSLDELDRALAHL